MSQIPLRPFLLATLLLTGATGLARPPEQVDEAPPVLQPLDMQADRLGIGVLDHELEEVAEFQVGLVADRGELGEADIGVVLSLIHISEPTRPY